MIYYILSLCIWVLVIAVGMKSDSTGRALIGLILVGCAVHALAQLLQGV